MFKLVTLINLILFVKIATCNVCPTQESGEQDNNSNSNEPCFDTQSYDYILNKSAQQEKQVEFECYVRNKGSYSVTWLHENQLITFNDKVIKPDSNIQLDTDSERKFNLKILNVDSNHKGNYKCQIITLVAKNLDYNLDVLIPPSISRIPNSDLITLKEGDMLTIQCLTQGNPKPKVSWSKKGEKASHTTVDELRSSLTLENVDESHSDSYSCTAKNGIGNPVTSEFQIVVKFKPKITFAEQENINKSVLYSGNGRKEQIKCVVSAYPMPKIHLLYNNEMIPASSYAIEEVKENDQRFVLVYTFIGSNETYGEYVCLAENELGSSSSQLTVSSSTSEVTLTTEKLPVYSDAVVFEWSVLSGSPIQELHVQLFNPNNTNGTNLITKTKQLMPDGTEMPATYHNENIIYKDFYDITKLTPNTTYTLRLRVKNENDQWSDWSQTLTVRTHPDENEKLTRHKSFQSLHNHRHHERKHKINNAQSAASSNLNSKRERFNSYYSDKNSAIGIFKNQFINLSLIIILSSFIFYLFN